MAEGNSGIPTPTIIMSGSIWTITIARKSPTGTRVSPNSFRSRFSSGVPGRTIWRRRSRTISRPG